MYRRLRSQNRVFNSFHKLKILGYQLNLNSFIISIHLIEDQSDNFIYSSFLLMQLVLLFLINFSVILGNS